jgi:hypothetical protein
MKKIFSLFVMFGVWAFATALSQPRRALKQPILADAGADPEVVGIFERSCQNCHSPNTEWPLYGRVFPITLLLRHDVQTAKSHMDLSRWQTYEDSRKRRILSEIGVVVRNGTMPPYRYTLLHPAAKLTTDEANRIYQWTRSSRNLLKPLKSESGD